MNKPTTYKFAARNFSGQPVRHYLVEERELPPASPAAQRIGHHILVVDASGSMYGDIDKVKEQVRKMLTLDEYRDSSLLVSLLSYSSAGDLIEHFTRVPVSDIVRSRNTKAQREIGGLRARGMTCMTQALSRAIELADEHEDELTAISVHTDGYFNDPSPTAEMRAVDALIDVAKKIKNLFVNCIGYRDCCDYKLLSKIANALSGKCVQAQDVKTFYDALYDTTSLLAGQSAQALYLERGDCDYQVFVSSDGKVVGGSDDLSINGVRGDALRTVYRFRQVEIFDGPGHTFSRVVVTKDGTEVTADLPVRGALAFALCQLAEGRVNLAKYAVVSTRDMHLLERHAKALTSRDLAAFASDLSDRIFSGGMALVIEGTPYGLSNTGPTVPAVLEVLSRYRGDFTVDMFNLTSGYQRRGVKRVCGTRSPDGKIVAPPVDTELRSMDRFVPVSAFEFNRSDATINMRIAQPCKLLKGGKEVSELAGKKLDLQDFRQYTIVGDGEVNVDSLTVKISSKRLYRELFDLYGKAFQFDPNEAITIELDKLPLVDYASRFDAKALAGLPERLATLHAMDKLLSALLREKSADLTPEQVAELKAHCISPAMYFSAPTTNPYADLKVALSAGEVDVRLAYEVHVGTPDMLRPSDLWSANEFLRRWYEPTSKAITDPKKATMAAWYEEDFNIEHKKLGPKVKVTPVDRLMAKVFDEFFGLAMGGTMDEFLTVKTKVALHAVLAGDEDFEEDEKVEAITDARREIGEALDLFYMEEVAPLVFYVGASGLMPDDFGDVPALTAEQLVAKYPAAQPDKAMRADGAFYDLGSGTIVTVVTTPSYFSTERGVAVAQALEASAVGQGAS